MESVGTVLRSERSRQGRGLAEISAVLCITQSYLEAIEKDDLEALPGTFFYKSFVKQYAKLLGVPEAKIQKGVESLTAPAAEPPLPGQDSRYTSAPPGADTGLIGEMKLLLKNFRGNKSTGAEAPLRPDAPIRVVEPLVESTNRTFSGHRLGASIAGLAVVLLFCSGFYEW